jgi:hypothetical protein
MACGHCGVSRRAAGSAAAAFLALQIMDYVVHEKLLGPVYRSPKYADLWNVMPVMTHRMWALLLSNALVSVTLTLIFARGYEPEKCGKGQGLRFGLLAWLVAWVPLSLHQYFVYPVSARLVGAWLAAGLAEALVVGLLIGLIYKPEVEAPHTH